MTPTVDQMRVLIEALARPELGSPRNTAPRDLARFTCRLRGWLDRHGRLTVAGRDIASRARVALYGRTGPRGWTPYRSGPRFWDVAA